MTRKEEISKRLLEIGTSNFGTANEYVAYMAGYMDASKWADSTMIEKACEWLRNNLRNYVVVDPDGVACLGHWENAFRKAMKGGE